MTLPQFLRRLTAAALASSLMIAVGSVAASAAPNSDVYRASATGPDAAPISEQLVVVSAPEPGAAAAPVLVLRTVFRRTTKRTDIVEAPRLGRGRISEEKYGHEYFAEIVSHAQSTTSSIGPEFGRQREEFRKAYRRP